MLEEPCLLSRGQDRGVRAGPTPRDWGIHGNRRAAGERPSQHVSEGPLEHPVCQQVRSRPDGIRLGSQRIGQHVVRLGGVLEQGEQLGIGAVLSEPMLQEERVATRVPVRERRPLSQP